LRINIADFLVTILTTFLIPQIFSDPQTVGLPPFLPTNPHLTAVSTPSTTSFLPPTTGNNIYINRSVLQTTNSWNAMVDEFVRKNVTSGFFFYLKNFLRLKKFS